MSESLSILLPERTLTLGDQSVVVHEYTLAEQLQHRAHLKAISDGFKAAMQSAQDAEISIDNLMDVLATHWESVILSVAVSCGQPVKWVSQLTGEDSEALLMVWWGVNAPFFTREAIREAMVELVKNQTSLLSGGPSSLVSSATGTTSAPSHTTQQDN